MSLLAACSAETCKDLKSKIGPLAFGCGAQGDAPPAEELEPRCRNAGQLGPALIALARDPQKPLAALVRTLELIDEPRCVLPERACSSDAQCGGARCVASRCPCARTYRPLGELLRSVLGLLQAMAREPAEPGAHPGDRCVSLDAATALAADQRNRGCELKRAVDIVLDPGGRALLSDARLVRAISAISGYLSGRSTGTPRPEAIEALGRMARSPLCPSEDFASVGEKLFANLGPELVAEILATVRALAADPDVKPFVAALRAGDGAAGRESVIFLVHYFVGEARAVRTGSEAARILDEIVSRFLLPAAPTDALRAKLRAAFAILGRALADEVGAFPALQRLIACADDSTIGGGALVGAAFDLLVTPAGSGGLDAMTLLDLFEAAMRLDRGRQLTRAGRELMLWLEGDEHASSSLRSVTATALCGSPHDGALCDGKATATGLLPAIDLLARTGALADLLPLLDTLLRGCVPAKGAP